ncbi:hypothetical protein SAMN05216330_111105 [Bradyrhizobium sp. Ghvi]|nr:hypothetical protein SAMN05216330_111105 [Bradyrhizobium sp. Ghvi]
MASYRVAPFDSVHALGVVSINYARFELTHVWMLAAVGNMKERQAAVISARTNPSDRVKLIETFITHAEWSDEALAAIKHYLKAMGILTTNRNVLVHSNMVEAWKDQTAIYSISRKGTTNIIRSSLEEIRQVADDLNEYFDFGHMLSNYIASEVHRAALEAGMMVVSKVPPLPPMPFTLILASVQRRRPETLF